MKNISFKTWKKKLNNYIQELSILSKDAESPHIAKFRYIHLIVGLDKLLNTPPSWPEHILSDDLIDINLTLEYLVMNTIEFDLYDIEDLMNELKKIK